jgi:nitroimidazol reductase NimA-like FMN-containing flavoprotein (pyridoxamine 5'-phosphate oxidase superfamily)
VDPELEQTVRAVLAQERFGVLATAADGRIHTATILFAETPEWELVHAIRPATLKAQLAYAAPEAAFQVDNRAVVDADRTRFVRVGFEGVLRRVPRDDPAWEKLHDVYTAKLPAGRVLLENPEVELHVLTPWTVRVAIGGHPAADMPVGLPDTPPSAEGSPGS